MQTLVFQPTSSCRLLLTLQTVNSQPHVYMVNFLESNQLFSSKMLTEAIFR